jgi:hypothetical protein
VLRDEHEVAVKRPDRDEHSAHRAPRAGVFEPALERGFELLRGVEPLFSLTILGFESLPLRHVTRERRGSAKRKRRSHALIR